MQMADLGDISLHYREDGDRHGAPVVFANSLGTDLRLWDRIMPLLPEGLRIIRYDKRGHGLSDCPPAPYRMGALVRDAERLLDLLEVRDCVFVGLSIGGMIAQGLAVKRFDQVRALVLSNTAAKIGQPEMWQERIDTVRADGTGALADLGDGTLVPEELSRQCPGFSRLAQHAFAYPGRGLHGLFRRHCRHGFLHPDKRVAPADAGYRGFRGSRDAAGPRARNRGADPRVAVRADPGAGHLPCVDRPEDYATLLGGFLKDIGHV